LSVLALTATMKLEPDIDASTSAAVAPAGPDPAMTTS